VCDHCTKPACVLRQLKAASNPYDSLTWIMLDFFLHSASPLDCLKDYNKVRRHLPQQKWFLPIVPRGFKSAFQVFGASDSDRRFFLILQLAARIGAWSQHQETMQNVRGLCAPDALYLASGTIFRITFNWMFGVNSSKQFPSHSLNW